MPATQFIEMMAGTDPQGQPVIEQIPVQINDQDACTLVKSPAFVKGIAAGDQIKLNRETQQFELLQRSGNLCIRVYCRGDSSLLSEKITAELEKLGGSLDLETPRMLVYSIHVSCGFNAIEDIFNRHLQEEDAVWMYGNVYDPQDGTTPLNWWQTLLKPE